MAFKYQKLMQEWEMTMDSPILDKAFIAKVNDFNSRLEKKSLTDEEANAMDEELCTMFTELHKLEEVDSPEVAQANRRAEIADGKAEIAQAETIEELQALQDKFDSYPELQPFIKNRIDKLQNAAQQSKNAQIIAEGKKEIKAADYQDLEALLEKYKEFPDLCEIINERIAKEDPAKEIRSKRQMLSEAKKREFSYSELRAMGIEPTGDDMEIEGVFLERQYLYKIYRITKVDGKKV